MGGEIGLCFRHRYYRNLVRPGRIWAYVVVTELGRAANTDQRHAANEHGHALGHSTYNSTKQGERGAANEEISSTKHIADASYRDETHSRSERVS